jgi:hypothetical protein
VTVGYSGTPLWKKLGLKAGMAAAVRGAPPDWAELMSGAPLADWGPVRPGVACVILFHKGRVALEQDLAAVISTMARDGMIWISWPKKASKLPTDITEDVIRDVCLPMGLVDIKVCAVSDIWSGLKLVIRRELR